MAEERPIFRESTLSRKTGSWRDPELKQKPRYLTESEAVSACKNACPLKNEIPFWISLLRQGKDKEAWEKLIEKNPFPAVTGRVCPAFCEKECNRKEFDEPVSIRELERFLGDEALKNNWRPPASQKEVKRNIAVVGSGPAGLSCAYQLARRGYRVKIFEKLPVLGGMMMVGIPDFRLPKDVLIREIDNIANLGVGIHKGVAINEKFLKYLAYAYDAVFLATGLQKPRKLNIPGEESNPNVLYGLDFLKDVNLGKKVAIGQTVAVIGGGNTAIDVARTAKKLGRGNVSIFYRRTMAEMPAIASEVKEAESEGISIEELVTPVGISYKVVAFQKTKLSEPDKNGRKNFIPIENSYSHGDFDNIIIAVGEEKETVLTADNKKIFNVEDAGTVAQAIELGRLAAESFDGVKQEKELKVVRFGDINTAYFRQDKRSADAAKEAERCFSCGLCCECDNCWNFCPEPAVKKTGDSGKPYNFDYDYCKGCGICAKECPRGVIVMEEENES